MLANIVSLLAGAIAGPIAKTVSTSVVEYLKEASEKRQFERMQKEILEYWFDEVLDLIKDHSDRTRKEMLGKLSLRLVQKGQLERLDIERMDDMMKDIKNRIDDMVDERKI